MGPRRVEAEEADVTDAAAQAPPDASEPIFPGEVSFRESIRPIFDRPREPPMGTGRGCKGCHYRTETNHVGLDLSSLDLSTLGALRKGGGSSDKRIIVARKPNESALLLALDGKYPHSTRMPKNGPFWDDAERDLVRDWIAQGAKGADDE